MHMRRTMMGLVAVTTLALSACGGSTKYVNKPKPALPINLTVYIGDSKVSVSPTAVGAGPVTFEVTNQSSKAQSFVISSSAGSLASTGPINPQGAAQVSVNLSQPGTYTVSTGNAPSTDASLNGPSAPQSATVRVGSARPPAGGTLLYP